VSVFIFLFGSDYAAAPYSEVVVIALQRPRQPKPRGIRSRKWLDAVDGALRQGDRTSMAPAGNELGARKIEALAENVPIQL